MPAGGGLSPRMGGPMKRHILRAPQTDRYILDVPCSPSDLDCSSPVLATDQTTVVIESTGRTLTATSVEEDPKGIVTSQSPLTITPRLAGLYMAVVTVTWDSGMAYADRVLAAGVSVNGVSVGSKVDSARVGALHQTQAVIVFRAAVGDAVTFTAVAVPNTTMNSATIKLIQVGP